MFLGDVVDFFFFFFGLLDIAKSSKLYTHLYCYLKHLIYIFKKRFLFHLQTLLQTYLFYAFETCDSLDAEIKRFNVRSQFDNIQIYLLMNEYWPEHIEHRFMSLIM